MNCHLTKTLYPLYNSVKSTSIRHVKMVEVCLTFTRLLKSAIYQAIKESMVIK